MDPLTVNSLFRMEQYAESIRTIKREPTHSLPNTDNGPEERKPGSSLSPDPRSDTGQIAPSLNDNARRLFSLQRPDTRGHRGHEREQDPRRGPRSPRREDADRKDNSFLPDGGNARDTSTATVSSRRHTARHHHHHDGEGSSAARPQDGSDRTDTTDATGEDNGASLREKQEAAKLRERDAEVRTHEAMHLAAAGPHAAGGPFYEFQVGPDGRSYAVGGHVSLDMSPIPGDPAATMSKAQMLRRAALAPANPSAADMAVARAATAMESQARQELLAELRQAPKAVAVAAESPGASRNPMDDALSEAEARPPRPDTTSASNGRHPPGELKKPDAPSGGIPSASFAKLETETEPESKTPIQKAYSGDTAHRTSGHALNLLI